MSALQSHQQRVLDEKAQLDERLAKLDAFTCTDAWWKVDGDERERLQLQASVMRQYSNILQLRINAWK